DKTPALGSGIDRRVRAGGVVEKTALQRVKDAVVAAIEGVDILVIAVAVVVDDRRTRMQHVAVRRGANVGTMGQTVGRRILVLLVVRATYPGDDLVAHGSARVLRAPGGDRTDRGGQGGKADERAAGTVDVDVFSGVDGAGRLDHRNEGRDLPTCRHAAPHGAARESRGVRVGRRTLQARRRVAQAVAAGGRVGHVERAGGLVDVADGPWAAGQRPERCVVTRYRHTAGALNDDIQAAAPGVAAVERHRRRV